MSFEIAVIGDNDFTLGFRLAGIKKSFDIKKMPIKEAVADKSIGIIILNDVDVRALPTHIQDSVRNSVSPVAVVISDDGGAEENLRKLIKKSIGIDLRK
ncbi:V-type ATP synthase subunit F [archaeon]|nr:V-type ATP synthase subunit F [Nanoarchaeota archaeon]MBU4300034.1 V-type ATP synthase subunit F [Nanoarchaeota archaeon]MBU4451835.1 V-type ATP synthase subunit F [Nanoarchaeota archaeon]MCG2724429.1 V-type ATP synthase subunit F [archaeon]